MQVSNQSEEEVQEIEVREPPPSRPKSSPLDHHQNHNRLQYVQGKASKKIKLN